MLLQYGVLERFDGRRRTTVFRLDLDGFAVSDCAHARLAVRFHDAADARDYELAAAPLAFLRELEKLFKERAAFFFDVLSFSAMCDTVLVLLIGLAAI